MSTNPATKDAFFEAPTQKRVIPDELLEGDVSRHKRESGIRTLSSEERERMARRNRDTLPAPPDDAATS